MTQLHTINSNTRVEELDDGQGFKLVPPQSLAAYVGLRWTPWPWPQHVPNAAAPHPPKRPLEGSNTGQSTLRTRWYTHHMHDTLQMKYIAPLPDTARDVFPLAVNKLVRDACRKGREATAMQAHPAVADPFGPGQFTKWALDHFSKETSVTGLYSAFLGDTVVPALNAMFARQQAGAPKTTIGPYSIFHSSARPGNMTGAPDPSTGHLPPRTMLHPKSVPTPDIMLSIDFRAPYRMLKSFLSAARGSRDKTTEYFGLDPRVVQPGKHAVALISTKFNMKLSPITQPGRVGSAGCRVTTHSDSTHAGMMFSDLEAHERDSQEHFNAKSEDTELEMRLMDLYPALKDGLSEPIEVPDLMVRKDEEAMYQQVCPLRWPLVTFWS
jgi:hypothetical protein